MKRFYLLLLDIATFYTSLYFTLLIRYRAGFLEWFDLHLTPFTIILCLWLAIFYIADIYDIIYLKNDLAFSTRFWQAIAVSAVLSTTFFYLNSAVEIAPKTNLFLFTLIFAVLDYIMRLLFNKAIASPTFKNNTIIIGANQQAFDLAALLKDNPQFGYILKHIVDIGENGESDGERYSIIRSEDIERVIRDEKIRTVVLSPNAYRSSNVISTLYGTLNKKINFYNLPYFYEITTGKVPLGAIDQTWFLTNLTEGKKKVYEPIKRVLDIILASVLGVIFLLTLPFIAFFIKHSSRGPIFYKQTRVGRYGKPFDMIKFRTMADDAEKGVAVWASANDPRITKVGRFLRRARLDEFPQFWNIIKGEMTFVGPRAERPEFDEKLKDHIPFYKERYLVRPGLTGWAQVKYRYGASVQDALEKLQYDLFYIKHRSPILDLAIVLRTLNIVFRQTGR